MEKTTSQKALKVVSIIMIVFAALTLLLGIVGIVAGGALGALAAGSGGADAALLGGLAVVGSLFIIASGAIDLLIGIFGLRGANDPRKIGVFYVLAIIGLVLAVLSVASALLGGNTDAGGVGGALVGLILPGLCVFLAHNIKKENNL